MHANGVDGVMIPALSAASAMIGLKVEPVGYEPPIARFSVGVVMVSLKRWVR